MTITRNTPLEQLPEFLTPEEYQAYFGFSRAKAYSDIVAGHVRALRVGRLWRIPRAAIVEMAREPQPA